MNLPQDYKWLTELPVLPRTISIALELFGTQEVVGRGSNPKIMAWRDLLKEAGVKGLEDYTDDDIAWCGLLAAIVTFRRRTDASEVVDEPLWAQNWATYGVKSPKAGLGDVLVFKRPGGGHVGFYVGEDSECYHVLGGNQSNKVCITRVQKSRCIAVRRPRYANQPETVRAFHLSSSGEVSKNEA